VERLNLQAEELARLDEVVAPIVSRYDTAEAEEFLYEAPVLAHQLPSRVQDLLNRVRQEEFPACIIAGHRVDDTAIGPTPPHWKTRQVPSPALAQEAVAVLYACLLGEVFGWATQQDGYLIHEVLPIRGYEQEQVGFSSEALLTWHTEDAFHPLRGDYLILTCLRNPDSASTTIGSIDGVELDPACVDVLFQPRFTIRPDESHLPKNNTTGDAELFEDVEQMNNRPEPLAPLFGDPAQPYIRVDPYFMDVVEGDGDAAKALGTLVQAMDEQMTDVVLQPGDVCVLDNYRVVHGRKPFAARFDGTDRWLKRLNVTRDLRKSWGSRQTARSRIIG
jgi:Fe(II)/alpha-ketoglutarate-dependent arginine beta-hydroxylase